MGDALHGPVTFPPASVSRSQLGVCMVLGFVSQQQLPNLSVRAIPAPWAWKYQKGLMS